MMPSSRPSFFFLTLAGGGVGPASDADDSAAGVPAPAASEAGGPGTAAPGSAASGTPLPVIPLPVIPPPAVAPSPSAAFSSAALPAAVTPSALSTPPQPPRSVSSPVGLALFSVPLLPHWTRRRDKD